MRWQVSWCFVRVDEDFLTEVNKLLAWSRKHYSAKAALVSWVFVEKIISFGNDKDTPGIFYDLPNRRAALPRGSFGLKLLQFKDRLIIALTLTLFLFEKVNISANTGKSKGVGYYAFGIETHHENDSVEASDPIRNSL